MHPLLEAAQAGSSARIGEEHVAHQASIEVLQAEVAALAAALTAAAAVRLYRHWALFMAENLEHMHFEETAYNTVLWSIYSDDELKAVHGRLLASIAPAEMDCTLVLMLPALTPQQRAGLLGGVGAEAQPEAFQGALALAKQVLDAAGWARLAPALGLVTA